LAAARQHEADEIDRLPRHSRLDQLGALGRGGSEKRPFGLAQGRSIAIVAFGRGSERRLRKRRITREEAARGERAGGKDRAAAGEIIGHSVSLRQTPLPTIPAKFSP